MRYSRSYCRPFASVNLARATLASVAALSLSACATLSPLDAPARPDALSALETVDYAPAYSGEQVLDITASSLGALGGGELTQLLAVLRDDNFDIAAARARIDQAAAAQRAATGARLPGASYNLSAGPSRVLNFLSPQPTWTTTASGSVSANWNLDIFGGLREEARAQFFTTEAAKLTAQRLRQTLSAQLVDSYIGAWALSEQIKITQSLAESFEQTADLTNQRYRDGSAQISALDVQITRQNALSTRANLPELEAQYKAQLFVIDALLARTAGSTRLSFAQLNGDAALPAMPLGLPIDGLRARADVAAAELQFLAAHSDIHAAKAQLKPSLSLTGSVSQNALEIKDIFNIDTLGASVLAGLAGPIFNGGQLKAAVDIARAAKDELAANYASTAYAAYSDVRTAVEFEQAYQEKRAQLRGVVEAAALSDRIATQRYTSGQVSILTVLETRRALFGARQELLSAQQQTLQARVDLLLALGGGWDDGNTAYAEDAAATEFSPDNPLITTAKKALTQ